MITAMTNSLTAYRATTGTSSTTSSAKTAGASSSFGPAVVTTLSDTPPTLLAKTSKDPSRDAEGWKIRIESDLMALMGSASGAWAGSEEGLAHTVKSFNQRLDAGTEKWKADLAGSIKSHRERAVAAEPRLQGANSSLEGLGFKVEGNLYEKGADGQWHPGTFTVTGEGHGFSIQYSSSGVSSITYHDDPTETADGSADLAASTTEQGPSAAEDKSAVAEDIFAKATKEAEQYTGLIKMMDSALETARQTKDDPAAQKTAEESKAKVEAFQFSDWKKQLQEAGFTVPDKTPVIQIHDDGTASVNRAALAAKQPAAVQTPAARVDVTA